MSRNATTRKTVPVAFRLRPDQRLAVEAVAVRRGQLMAHYVRDVVLAALEREAPPWGVPTRNAEPRVPS